MSDYFQKTKDNFSTVFSKNFFIPLLFSIIGILSIGVIGFFFTKDLELWIDIGLADEAKYLGDGVNFLRTKVDASWGPLYSLWYHTLNIFSPDTINLYYLNYKLMTIIPCIALYLFLLKLKVTPLLSFYFSFALLISLINLPTWPKVSHFALTMIFIGLMIIQSIKGRNTRLLAAFIISLIITYIRPEFIFSSIIFFGIMTKRAVSKGFDAERFMIAILTIVMFFLLLGIPYSSGRNLTAFGQAYHKYLDLEDRIDGDGSKDWTEILSEDFDNPKSIFDVVLNDSDKFFNHIKINLTKLPMLYLSSVERLLPDKIFPVNILIKIVIVLLIISSVFVLLLFNRFRWYRNIILYEFTDNKDLLFFSVIFSLPPLLSMILYYPRSHYIILLLPLIYLVLGQMIMPIKLKGYGKNIISFCVLILISFLITTQLSSFNTKSNFKNLLAVQNIKALNISERINLLENEGGLNVYLPDNYKWVKLVSKKENFDKFVNIRNINMIYYSFSLNNSVQLKRDPTWSKFLINPDTFNFKELIKNDGGVIYIRKDIKLN